MPDDSDSDASPPRRSRVSGGSRACEISIDTDTMKRCSPDSGSDASPPRLPRRQHSRLRSPVRGCADADALDRPRVLRQILTFGRDVSTQTDSYSLKKPAWKPDMAAESSQRRRRRRWSIDRDSEPVASATTQILENAKPETRQRGQSALTHAETSTGRKRFAVTADDPDLNDVRRKRRRWGDPMAGILDSVPECQGSKVDCRQSGSRSRAVYDGPPAPPNRYGIRPGPHWDGVDRTNGFEARLDQFQAAATAKADEAFRKTMSGL